MIKELMHATVFLAGKSDVAEMEKKIWNSQMKRINLLLSAF